MIEELRLYSRGRYNQSRRSLYI